MDDGIIKYVSPNMQSLSVQNQHSFTLEEKKKENNDEQQKQNIKKDKKKSKKKENDQE